MRCLSESCKASDDFLAIRWDLNRRRGADAKEPRYGGLRICRTDLSFPGSVFQHVYFPIFLSQSDADGPKFCESGLSKALCESLCDKTGTERADDRGFISLNIR